MKFNSQITMLSLVLKNKKISKKHKSNIKYKTKKKNIDRKKKL